MKEVEVTGEWRKLHNEGFMICTPHQIFGYQMKEDETGRAFVAYWREIMHQVLW
jgi:hypothetical protein